MVASTACLRGKTGVPSCPSCSLLLSFPICQEGRKANAEDKVKFKNEMPPASQTGPLLRSFVYVCMCVYVCVPCSFQRPSPPLPSLSFSFIRTLLCWSAIPVAPPRPPSHLFMFRCLSLSLSLCFSLSLSLTQTQMSLRCLTSVEPRVSVAEIFSPRLLLSDRPTACVCPSFSYFTFVLLYFCCATSFLASALSLRASCPSRATLTGS